MYPFSVKFKIKVEKTSPEMTVNNLTDYFKEKLKSEEVEIISETAGKFEFSNSLKFRFLSIMSMVDKGYIKIEKIGVDTFKIIYRIPIIRLLILNFPFMLIIGLLMKQLYPVLVFLFAYILGSLALIGKQYNFFSNNVDRYLESAEENT